MGEQYRWKRSVVMVAGLFAAAVGTTACGAPQAQQPVVTPPPPTPADVAPAPALDAAAAPSADAMAPAADAAPVDAGAVSDAAVATTDAAPADAAPAATYSGPPPYFNLRPPRVGAGISANQVQALIRRHQADLLTCYTNVLATNPRARGVLSARVTVIAGGVGQVNSVRMAPRNESIEQCARNVIQGWSWPNPSGNNPSVDISFQIDLAPTPPAGAHH